MFDTRFRTPINISPMVTVPYMEVETSRVHDLVYHRGRVHSNIRRGEGSHVAALTVSWLLGEKMTRPSRTDHLLRLPERNTPHLKSSLYCEDKTYRGTISSHLGARNLEKARSPEDWHRGEHRWLPDKATPKSTLQSTKDKDGTTTNNRAEQSQTGSKG